VGFPHRTIAGLFGGVILGGILAYAWFPPAPGPIEIPDKVLVLKREHKMVLLRQGKELRTYPIALGRNPVGAKERLGDHKTPEGIYILDSKNSQSGFHLAMHVSYPNQEDRKRSIAEGVDPGGDIMVHGIKNGLGWTGRYHRWVDWTDGCIAVTNPEMDQIWTAIPDGTPIEIRP
jgi:murein L,D-transpeptidase YafK